uniref:Uncharacterized protein n=1 Tax=Arundo donax TaxID=35708 RepID=A0A0A8Y5A2_ARUDO
MDFISEYEATCTTTNTHTTISSHKSYDFFMKYTHLRYS